MSVVSSRVSSVSSILKGAGVRSQLIRQANRVYFKLPKNLKSIIYNFESGNGTKDYEDLICTLRDSNIKDSDLTEFLSDVRQCIPLLGKSHKLLIEALLRIKWTNHSTDVTSVYKVFLEDLICMQIHHTKCVIDNLVGRFEPVSCNIMESLMNAAEDNDAEWEGEQCREADIQRLNHVHDVLKKILRTVPMSSKLLLQSIRARFPYIFHGTHVHEIYTHALLQITEYAPQLRSDILSLIINRLVVLDVNIPHSVEDDDGESNKMDEDGSESDGISTDGADLDNRDNDKSMEVHPIAHTLDVCMEQIFKYIHDVCFDNGVLDVESLRSLYLDIIRTFETVILPTHASRYVQYVIFYICSFKTAVVEAFVDWSWRKITDPNVPSVTRQSLAAYIASFLATASYISSSLIKTTQSKLSQWIHAYIDAQDSTDGGDDTKEHGVFYSVCQALFFIITSRHQDFVDSKNNILYLQELDIPKIVACKLNPLKTCLPEIVHMFADLTRTYQLAYCYTIIENNSRSQLPILQNSSCSSELHENCFPFSAYTLQRSGQRIAPLIYNGTVRMNRTLINRYKHDDAEFLIE